MLTIIIGIIVSIILTFIFFEISNEDPGSIVLGFILIIVSILAGIFYPFSGYNDWKMIKETK